MVRHIIFNLNNMRKFLPLIAILAIYEIIELLGFHYQLTNLSPKHKQSQTQINGHEQTIIMPQTNIQQQVMSQGKTIRIQRQIRGQQYTYSDFLPQGNHFAQQRILQSATCGDGIVDPNQQCDDGNTNDDDGCDSDCLIQKKISTGVIIVIVVVSSAIIITGIVVAVKYCCYNEQANEDDKNRKKTGSEQHLPSVNHDNDQVVAIESQNQSNIKR